MHVLVVGDDGAERQTIGRALQSQHRVGFAADSAAALQVLERESPEVVVLSWKHDSENIVRQIRSYDETRHTYVLALCDERARASIPAMYQAGIDDFMVRPLVTQELVLRAEAPLRIRQWREALTPATAIDRDGRVDLRKLNCFRNMGHVVGEDLAQVVGALEVAEGWLIAGELRGAAIPMSVTSERAEIRVSVVVETRLVKSLAEALLGDGDASSDALEDMLREIANTAGGALKRAAGLENIVVTTGLPVNEARGVTRNEMTKCWTALLAGSQMQLGIIAEIHKRTNLRLSVEQLEEGMVLSSDLHNDCGELVMAGGTRLTATAVARISNALGPCFEVDVSSAA